MTQYYAVSLSVSQGAFDATASGTLVYADDRQETVMSLVWPTMPPQPDPENAGAWLLNVLEDIVTNFHAHEVRGAKTGPRSVNGQAV